jgi:hypothetical protein
MTYTVDFDTLHSTPTQAQPFSFLHFLLHVRGKTPPRLPRCFRLFWRLAGYLTFQLSFLSHTTVVPRMNQDTTTNVLSQLETLQEIDPGYIQYPDIRASELSPEGLVPCQVAYHLDNTNRLLQYILRRLGFGRKWKDGTGPFGTNLIYNLSPSRSSTFFTVSAREGKQPRYCGVVYVAHERGSTKGGVFVFEACP